MRRNELERLNQGIENPTAFATRNLMRRIGIRPSFEASFDDRFYVAEMKLPVDFVAVQTNLGRGKPAVDLPEGFNYEGPYTFVGDVEIAAGENLKLPYPLSVLYFRDLDIGVGNNPEQLLNTDLRVTYVLVTQPFDRDRPRTKVPWLFGAIGQKASEPKIELDEGKRNALFLKTLAERIKRDLTNLTQKDSASSNDLDSAFSYLATRNKELDRDLEIALSREQRMI